MLNTLGLKDSSSFVLSFRGKTLPLGDTLISDPSIGLLSYSTVNLFSEHLIGGGNICSDQKIEDDKRIPVKIGRSSPVNIGPTSPVSSGEEEYKVVLSEPAIHEPEPSRKSAENLNAASAVSLGHEEAERLRVEAEALAKKERLDAEEAERLAAEAAA